MPRRKKPPSEWTTEEAMKKLFPKPVRDRVRQEVEDSPKPQVKAETDAIKEDRI
jgi:hypothetical protein